MSTSESSPLVSVITPAYNSSKYILQTIRSVIGQTHQDWEMMVIDDRSTDDTAEVVCKAMREERRIHLICTKENKGPAICRNTGIDRARGRYIAFLDSDDIWLPRKLELQLDLMRRKDCPLTYSAYKKIDEQGNPIGGLVEVPSAVAYRDLLKTNVIGCLTAMYDTRDLGKRFMPLIPLRQDYALWLNILKTEGTAFGLNECLAFYRVRSRSISRNKLEAAKWQWRTYRKVEKLSLPASLYYFAHYVCAGIRKNRI